MESNLCDRPLAGQTRVKHRRGVSLHPAPAVVGTRKRVEVSTRRAKCIAVKRLLRQSVKLIEKIGIVDHSTRGRSNVHTVQKLIDRSKYFVDVPLLQEAGGRSISKQPLA